MRARRPRSSPVSMPHPIFMRYWVPHSGAQRDEVLLRQSVEASNQSRARKQADRALVIGLHCPQMSSFLRVIRCRPVHEELQ